MPQLPNFPNNNQDNDDDFVAEEYDDDDDLPPYPAGEAYQAYLENPIYENAIEAAEEIWGIPDPRLIED